LYHIDGDWHSVQFSGIWSGIVLSERIAKALGAENVAEIDELQALARKICMLVMSTAATIGSQVRVRYVATEHVLRGLLALFQELAWTEGIHL
jgi:hypothetical protein